MNKNKLVSIVVFGIMVATPFSSNGATIAISDKVGTASYILSDFIKSAQPKDYLGQAINGYVIEGKLNASSSSLKCSKVVNYDDLSESQKEVRILVKCENQAKNFVVVLPKKPGQKHSVLIKN